MNFEQIKCFIAAAAEHAHFSDAVEVPAAILPPLADLRRESFRCNILTYSSSPDNDGDMKNKKRVNGYVDWHWKSKTA